MNKIKCLICEKCKKEFYMNDLKKYRQKIRDMKRKNAKCYCAECRSTKTKLEFECYVCRKKIQRYKSQTKKSNNCFCSASCAASFNNCSRIKGNRRSKLEKWLEEHLTILYPNLEIHFNRKDAINSELDIYLPSLKLAFELNGIFHYEPIYGPEKLSQIQNNDNRKFQACLEKGIELCIIDTSSQKYFKEKNSQKFLEIIKTMISKNFFRFL